MVQVVVEQIDFGISSQYNKFTYEEFKAAGWKGCPRVPFVPFAGQTVWLGIPLVWN